MKFRLIDGCRHWWRMWSVRLQAIALALWTFAQLAPDAVISILNQLPPELRAFLPQWLLPVLIAGSLFARFIKQDKVSGNG